MFNIGQETMLLIGPGCKCLFQLYLTFSYLEFHLLGLIFVDLVETPPLNFVQDGCN